MNVHQKIKALRLFNDFTQEDMAEKLGYSSVQGYAKIERGETELTVSKLEDIAKVLGVSLQALLNLNGKNAVNIAENCQYPKRFQHAPDCLIVLTETECLNELEKARLLLHEREQEIGHLKFEIALLKKLVNKSE
ncbi:MAG: helix-turn-helix domain-containing protein [Methylobacter sp.]